MKAFRRFNLNHGAICKSRHEDFISENHFEVTNPDDIYHRLEDCING